MLAFLQRQWGPYPFTAAGALVTGEAFGSALETQTRPTYQGFATYSEWVWSQAHGSGTAEQLFEYAYAQHPADDPFWLDPLNQPAYALQTPAYERGAMLLQALRNRVGDPAFLRIMRSWAAQHRHDNADSADFAALATTVSGQDLASFFQAWISAPRQPASTVDNGFPAVAASALVAGRVAAPPAAAAIARSDAALAAVHQRTH